MSLIVSLLMRNWKILLLGVVLSGGVLYVSALKSANSSLREQVRVLEAERQAAIDAKAKTEKESEIALEKTNARHLSELSEAQANARMHIQKLQAALAAARGVACPLSLLPTTSATTRASEVPRTGETPGIVPDAMVDFATILADQCAATTVLYNEWRQLCQDQHRSCEVK